MMGTAKIIFNEKGEMKIDYNGYKGMSCNDAEKKILKMLALKLKMRMQRPKRPEKTLKEKEHA